MEMVYYSLPHSRNYFIQIQLQNFIPVTNYIFAIRYACSILGTYYDVTLKYSYDYRARGTYFFKTNEDSGNNLFNEHNLKKKKPL